jgi:hypothetical protein
MEPRRSSRIGRWLQRLDRTDSVRCRVAFAWDRCGSGVCESDPTCRSDCVDNEG